MVEHSTIWQLVRQLCLSCPMFYTLMGHAVSTNDSARYIRTYYNNSSEIYFEHVVDEITRMQK